MPNDLTSLDEGGRIIAFGGMLLMPRDELKLGKPKGRSDKSPKRSRKRKASPKPEATPKRRPPNPKPNW